jgi:hypothetical protein
MRRLVLFVSRARASTSALLRHKGSEGVCCAREFSRSTLNACVVRCCLSQGKASEVPRKIWEAYSRWAGKRRPERFPTSIERSKGIVHGAATRGADARTQTRVRGPLVGRRANCGPSSGNSTSPFPVHRVPDESRRSGVNKSNLLGSHLVLTPSPSPPSPP